MVELRGVSDRRTTHARQPPQLYLPCRGRLSPPPLPTAQVGTAFGTAAMLLANGKKGKRACLPNASIMLSQPRSQVPFRNRYSSPRCIALNPNTRDLTDQKKNEIRV